jgi:competence protein ComEC
MKRLILSLIGIIGLGALLLPFVLPHPAQLWVLSVGQGESVLYQDTTGKLLLFDGGPDDTVLSELGRILPPWHHHLDVVALSHTHADHVRGLISVLERYTVDAVWESGVDAPGNDVARWHRLIQTKQIPEEHPFAGKTFQLGNTHLLTLHPMESMVGKTVSDAHDATVVFQLFTTDARILLTGDLNEGHEKDIMDWCQSPQCNLTSDVLQVPHHGSDTGLSQAFLDAVHPRLAFICVGQNNQYRHPRQNILDRLGAIKIPFFRTDKDGGLKITFASGQLSYQKNVSVPR